MKGFIFSVLINRKLRHRKRSGDILRFTQLLDDKRGTKIWTFLLLMLCVWVCESMCVHAGVLSLFSRVPFFATLWTVTCQAPLSMGSLPAGILEWVAMPSSRASSQPRDQICVSYFSCLERRVLYHQHHLGRHDTPFQKEEVMNGNS